VPVGGASSAYGEGVYGRQIIVPGDLPPTRDNALIAWSSVFSDGSSAPQHQTRNPFSPDHGDSAGSIARPSAVAAQPVAAEEMNWSLA
jgi:hypothetical protein